MRLVAPTLIVTTVFAVIAAPALVDVPTIVRTRAYAATPDDEVRAEFQRADALLRSLEVQRARELLEAVLATPAWRRASTRVRARLWVTLGRARAEAGDLVGMSQAFENATRLDRAVALPPVVSPKILAALEDARVKVPVPEAPRPREPEARDPRGDGRSDARPDARGLTRAPRVNLRYEAPDPDDGRFLVWVEHDALPADARVDARRRVGDGPWQLLPLTRTGTVSAAELVVLPNRQALYVEVRQKQRVLARDGGPDAPALVVRGAREPSAPARATPTSATPTLAEATTRGPSPEAPQAAPRPASAGPPELASRPAPLDATGPTPDPLAPREAARSAPIDADAERDRTREGPSGGELAWIALGAAGLVGVAALLAVLTTPNAAAPCGGPSGTGCLEIVVPASTSAGLGGAR